MEAMSVVEVLKLVGQGGFPVLFALLILGLGYLVVKLGPQFLSAWNGQNAAISALASAVAANTAKLESIQVTLEAMRRRADSMAEDMAENRAANTGSHPNITVEEAGRVLRKK